MPVVLNRNGIRVMIWLPPREHGPAHVVVTFKNKQCEFWLTSLVVKSNIGRIKEHDLMKLRRFIEENQIRLIELWERYHGKS